MSSPLFNVKLYCYNLLNINRKYKNIAKSSIGVTYILPLIDSVGLGEFCKVYKNVSEFFYTIKAGSLTMLKFLKPNFIVSNLGHHTPKLSISNGTYSIINNLRSNFITITLPSTIKKNIPLNYFAFLGRNSGIYTYKEYLGKASVKTKKLSRIIVRSCAKNPVDHPNGGRTRGKQKIKTP